MKKNRPGILITLLAPPGRADTLMNLLLTKLLNPRCLQREVYTVQTPYGAVHIKVAREGEKILHLAPEYEDCARIAREQKFPMQQVLQLPWQEWTQSARNG